MVVKQHFNPRPREEGDWQTYKGMAFLAYFNPRPREEGDTQLPAQLRGAGISIHALVKRATVGKTVSDSKHTISIHALVKRATERRFINSAEFIDFNPRPREEGDGYRR